MYWSVVIMKKLLFTLLVIIIISCLGFILYLRPYNIVDNKKQLAENIQQFINRPKGYNNIDIKQELVIDNKKYVLFTMDDYTGFSELTKGFNNKYKIESVEYSSELLKDEIIKVKKEKYLLLRGKNCNNKIAYAKVKLDGVEYKINMPQDYYIVYCKVPVETQRTWIEIENIRLFDINDVDITREMFEVLF